MAIEFEHERVGSFLVVRLRSTESSVEASLEFGRELAALCQRLDCRRVLLDHREMTIRHPIFGHLALAEGMLEQLLTIHFDRVASVTGPDDYDRYRDFELLSRNRGFNFRAFQTMEDAREWLEAGAEG
jgi:hypothetical protein